MEGRDRQNLDLSTSTQVATNSNSAGQSRSKERYVPQTNSSWERIGLAALDKTLKFNNLMGHFNLNNLKAAYKALDKSKAVGIDGISKRYYGRNLEVNLQDLLERIKNGSYKPQTKRQVLIPKSDGKTRPIAISCFEDKLIEWIIGKTLTPIYEPLFIDNSFGFRPFKSAHGAIKLAFKKLKRGSKPYVVEIDFASFFNNIPHRKLMKIISKRITDNRFKGLIGRFLKVGILDLKEGLLFPEDGTPQGSIMSPILANIFLHEVLDLWFILNFSKRENHIIRYADDAIFLFRSKEEANEFMGELNARTTKYGIPLNKEKSKLIDFSKSSNNHFHFLGFTFYWGKRPHSLNRPLKIKTQKTKLHKKIHEFYQWIKGVRSKMQLKWIWRIAASKLKGHYEYYGFRLNRKKLVHFYRQALKSLFKWLNRRSQKPSFSWNQFKDRLKDLPLPVPPLNVHLKVIERSKFNVT